MLVDPDEHPSFYKLLFKEGFIDKILMPPAFIKENKSMLAKTCLLRTDEGVFWEAKIVREKCGYFLCEGEWPQFVEYHRLDLGDVLLFFLIDKSTFQVLPYKQKRYRNLRGKQVFEELSSSSKEDADEDEEDEEEEEEEEEENEEEEEEEETPRKSKKCKSHAIEYSDDNEGESKDSSSGSKDKESPRYFRSGFIMKGGESNGEANKVLYKKKAPPGLKLLLKACQEQPANSIIGGWKRGRARRERDPNKPKQPTTAFFVFMEEFRKQFAKKNPHNHDICIVGRAGGDRWNQLPEAEKAPYIREAEKRKVEYKENLRAYYDRKASKEDASDNCRSAVVEEEMHDYVLVNTEIGKRKTGAVEEEEAESGSEENGPKKVRSNMVNFNNKDPNFEVVVKKVTDTGQPLKTYLRRKYQREDKELKS
ncbi:high mobility group B protein 13-like isoform X1 [Lycium barbarum]|uniref:high mobility group B protein 13-like isoform X1 n=1 Tax=Lycium barbarum TaxID=112863 RepID=UPI00293F2533|nr:high mobility group B protein 13-like isoform X1 [Lycium barbarum]XP_060187107.1 high mobility group B protein 13-like isoform X1 [Lycium barbarum]XP_060187108.1 high mobility group B protein 13-like isoform X1 [Lycium barbarum]XP_060187109.1 high mobility group B protein 13-like isoform X1 [Lycium barbarum]XP_060187110.1 high mobility group B protein 13-like isoform X1 [Lycium barbarum]XP_060187111.1 high mobility group B protein 13-like isoform X1 [Lycium barbarum]XP_060187112.1 high mob